MDRDLFYLSFTSPFKIFPCVTSQESKISPMKTKEIGIERIEKEAPYFLVNEDKIQ